MKITKTKTERGFQVREFEDRYNNRCTIQMSSLAQEECIWMGVSILSRSFYKNLEPHEQIRMHLNRKMVKKIIPILQKFVDTGEI